MARRFFSSRARACAGAAALAAAATLSPGLAAAAEALPAAALPEVPGPDHLTAAATGLSFDLRWLCLVPPAVAIVLAVLLREVVTALVAGLFGGAVVLASAPAVAGDASPAAVPVAAFTGMLNDIVVPQATDLYHVQTILFTLLLGATVGVMSRSGGTRGLVEAVAGGAKTRTRAQGTVWGLGFLVFFDDYSNTLLLGGTTRPLTDRLKVSREKLAFLIDSTAAPVAGLALVSTWVGVEMSYISDGFTDIGAGGAGYDVFLATVPYRFYPIYLLAFVAAVAFTGRDFGPMRKAEQRAASGGGVLSPGTAAAKSAEMPDDPDAAPRAWNAAVPLAVLIGLLAWLMWQSGAAAVGDLDPARVPATVAEVEDRARAAADRAADLAAASEVAVVRGETADGGEAAAEALAAKAADLRARSELAAAAAAPAADAAELAAELDALLKDLAALPGGAVPGGWAYARLVIAKADSFVALLYAAAAASLVAVFMALVTRSLTLADAVDAWIAGARGMFTAEVILLLAWSIAAVCGELETGRYLGALVGDAVPVQWLPALGFVLAGGVAFAVGSSWGTMGILLPILIPIVWNLIKAGPGGDITGQQATFEAASGSAVMLGTIGAVLAGAIWGDHCSPISDTTVLSSASAQCGHLDHVATQFPYALSVGAVSILLGYLPAGFGVPWWALLPVGLLATVAVVRFAGRPVDVTAGGGGLKAEGDPVAA